MHTVERTGMSEGILIGAILVNAKGGKEGMLYVKVTKAQRRWILSQPSGQTNFVADGLRDRIKGHPIDDCRIHFVIPVEEDQHIEPDAERRKELEKQAFDLTLGLVLH